MTTQLFTVTLTDQGTYQVTVAADTAKDAEGIARGVLLEEATKLPDGMQIAKREVEAIAEVTSEQPIRKFRASVTYSVDFFMTVPAGSTEEAERHARRLYEAEPFPWEHETAEDRIRWHAAREVIS